MVLKERQAIALTLNLVEAERLEFILKWIYFSDNAKGKTKIPLWITKDNRDIVVEAMRLYIIKNKKIHKELLSDEKNNKTNTSTK